MDPMNGVLLGEADVIRVGKRIKIFFKMLSKGYVRNKKKYLKIYGVV